MYTLKLGQKRMVEKGWETKCEMGQRNGVRLTPESRKLSDIGK